MVRRPSSPVADLYGQVVPVRVTDMRGVDLNVWRFDWDLTFAVMLMHPDGTVLARYGGRDERGADHWLNAPSFQRFLEAGVAAYEDYPSEPAGGPPKEPLTVESIPAFAKRDRGECIHCHSANPALRHQAIEDGRWARETLWAYPPPSKLGLDLDQTEQARISTVRAGSPADRAGLRAEDRLVDVASATDLMAWLHELPAAETTASLEYQREGSGESATATLKLKAGWKTYTAREFAWRPSKWGLSPAPGFGGPVLSAPELAKLGLPNGTFAFEVNYLVTWGENQRWGQAAARAGIRDGMTVLGTANKRDFDSIDHFHAWWRLNVQPSSTVQVVIWRDGKESQIDLDVLAE